jgi:hypothetical protein
MTLNRASERAMKETLKQYLERVTTELVEVVDDALVDYDEKNDEQLKKMLDLAEKLEFLAMGIVEAKTTVETKRVVR